MNSNELEQDLEDELTESFSLKKIQIEYELQVDENESNKESSIDALQFVNTENDEDDNENQLDETLSLNASRLFYF